MQQPILKLLALACAMGLSACASTLPEHLALSLKAHDRFTSTEVVAPVIQSEIYIFIPHSQAGTAAGGGFGALGGMVGAMIDASVDASNAKAATTAVKPLRDALVDYNFDAKLKDDLQKSLAQVSWLKVDGVRVVKDIRPEAINGAVTGSTKGAVLMVASDYQLNADATVLTVAIKTHLFARDAALKTFASTETADAQTVTHPGNAIYRSRMVQTINLPHPAAPGTPVSRDENVKLWTADNAKLVRTSLDGALDTLCLQLAEDIQKEPEAVAAAGGVKTELKK